MEPWKRALRPLAEQFAEQFARLDDEYLAALVVARDKVSATNCWWVEFHLAECAAAIAMVELENRAQGIETRSAETERLSPKGESQVA